MARAPPPSVNPRNCADVNCPSAGACQGTGSREWSNSDFYARMEEKTNQGFGLLTPGYSMIQPSPSTKVTTELPQQQQQQMYGGYISPRLNQSPQYDYQPATPRDQSPPLSVRFADRFTPDGTPRMRNAAIVLEAMEIQSHNPAVMLAEFNAKNPNPPHKRRPSYVAAEEVTSPIPNYPTISAHWGSEKRQKKGCDDCFNSFLHFLGIGGQA